MSNIKQEELDALRLQAEGMSRPEIAAALGISERQVKSRLASGRRDPAIQEAMSHVGTCMEPSTVWIKDDKYSIMLRPKVVEGDTLQEIADAFDNVTPAVPVVAPRAVMSDLLTMYPLFDFHYGMLSWGKKTGQDYDTRLA